MLFAMSTADQRSVSARIIRVSIESNLQNHNSFFFTVQENETIRSFLESLVEHQQHVLGHGAIPNLQVDSVAFHLPHHTQPDEYQTLSLARQLDLTLGQVFGDLPYLRVKASLSAGPETGYGLPSPSSCSPHITNGGSREGLPPLYPRHLRSKSTVALLTHDVPVFSGGPTSLERAAVPHTRSTGSEKPATLPSSHGLPSIPAGDTSGMAPPLQDVLASNGPSTVAAAAVAAAAAEAAGMRTAPLAPVLSPPEPSSSALGTESQANLGLPVTAASKAPKQTASAVINSTGFYLGDTQNKPHPEGTTGLLEERGLASLPSDPRKRTETAGHRDNVVNKDQAEAVTREEPPSKKARRGAKPTPKSVPDQDASAPVQSPDNAVAEPKPDQPRSRSKSSRVSRPESEDKWEAQMKAYGPLAQAQPGDEHGKDLGSGDVEASDAAPGREMEGARKQVKRRKGAVRTEAPDGTAEEQSKETGPSAAEESQQGQGKKGSKRRREKPAPATMDVITSQLNISAVPQPQSEAVPEPESRELQPEKGGSGCRFLDGVEVVCNSKPGVFSNTEDHRVVVRCLCDECHDIEFKSLTQWEKHCGMGTTRNVGSSFTLPHLGQGGGEVRFGKWLELLGFKNLTQALLAIKNGELENVPIPKPLSPTEVSTSARKKTKTGGPEQPERKERRLGNGDAGLGDDVATEEQLQGQAITSAGKVISKQGRSMVLAEEVKELVPSIGPVAVPEPPKKKRGSGKTATKQAPPSGEYADVDKGAEAAPITEANGGSKSSKKQQVGERKAAKQSRESGEEAGVVERPEPAPVTGDVVGTKSPKKQREGGRKAPKQVHQAGEDAGVVETAEPAFRTEDPVACAVNKKPKGTGSKGPKLGLESSKDVETAEPALRSEDAVVAEVNKKQKGAGRKGAKQGLESSKDVETAEPALRSEDALVSDVSKEQSGAARKATEQGPQSSKEVGALATAEPDPRAANAELRGLSKKQKKAAKKEAEKVADASKAKPAAVAAGNVSRPLSKFDQMLSRGEGSSEKQTEAERKATRLIGQDGKGEQVFHEINNVGKVPNGQDKKQKEAGRKGTDLAAQAGEVRAMTNEIGGANKLPSGEGQKQVKAGRKVTESVAEAGKVDAMMNEVGTLEILPIERSKIQSGAGKVAADPAAQTGKVQSDLAAQIGKVQADPAAQTVKVQAMNTVPVQKDSVVKNLALSHFDKEGDVPIATGKRSIHGGKPLPGASGEQGEDILQKSGRRARQSTPEQILALVPEGRDGAKKVGHQLEEGTAYEGDDEMQESLSPRVVLEHDMATELEDQEQVIQAHMGVGDGLPEDSTVGVEVGEWERSPKPAMLDDAALEQETSQRLAEWEDPVPEGVLSEDLAEWGDDECEPDASQGPADWEDTALEQDGGSDTDTGSKSTDEGDETDLVSEEDEETGGASDEDEESSEASEEDGVTNEITDDQPSPVLSWRSTLRQPIVSSRGMQPAGLHNQEGSQKGRKADLSLASQMPTETPVSPSVQRGLTKRSVLLSQMSAGLSKEQLKERLQTLTDDLGLPPRYDGDRQTGAMLYEQPLQKGGQRTAKDLGVNTSKDSPLPEELTAKKAKKEQTEKLVVAQRKALGDDQAGVEGAKLKGDVQHIKAGIVVGKDLGSAPAGALGNDQAGMGELKGSNSVEGGRVNLLGAPLHVAAQVGLSEQGRKDSGKGTKVADKEGFGVECSFMTAELGEVDAIQDSFLFEDKRDGAEIDGKVFGKKRGQSSEKEYAMLPSGNGILAAALEGSALDSKKKTKKDKRAVKEDSRSEGAKNEGVAREGRDKGVGTVLDEETRASTGQDDERSQQKDSQKIAVVDGAILEGGKKSKKDKGALKGDSAAASGLALGRLGKEIPEGVKDALGHRTQETEVIEDKVFVPEDKRRQKKDKKAFEADPKAAIGGAMGQQGELHLKTQGIESSEDKPFVPEERPRQKKDKKALKARTNAEDLGEVGVLTEGRSEGMQEETEALTLPVEVMHETDGILMQEGKKRLKKGKKAVKLGIEPDEALPDAPEVGQAAGIGEGEEGFVNTVGYGNDTNELLVQEGKRSPKKGRKGLKGALPSAADLEQAAGIGENQERFVNSVGHANDENELVIQGGKKNLKKGRKGPKIGMESENALPSDTAAGKDAGRGMDQEGLVHAGNEGDVDEAMVTGMKKKMKKSKTGLRAGVGSDIVYRATVSGEERVEGAGKKQNMSEIPLEGDGSVDRDPIAKGEKKLEVGENVLNIRGGVEGTLGAGILGKHGGEGIGRNGAEKKQPKLPSILSRKEAERQGALIDFQSEQNDVPVQGDCDGNRAGASEGEPATGDGWVSKKRGKASKVSDQASKDIVDEAAMDIGISSLPAGTAEGEKMAVKAVGRGETLLNGGWVAKKSTLPGVSSTSPIDFRADAKPMSLLATLQIYSKGVVAGALRKKERNAAAGATPAVSPAVEKTAATTEETAAAIAGTKTAALAKRRNSATEEASGPMAAMPVVAKPAVGKKAVTAAATERIALNSATGKVEDEPKSGTRSPEVGKKGMQRPKKSEQALLVGPSSKKEQTKMAMNEHTGDARDVSGVHRKEKEAEVDEKTLGNQASKQTNSQAVSGSHQGVKPALDSKADVSSSEDAFSSSSDSSDSSSSESESTDSGDAGQTAAGGEKAWTSRLPSTEVAEQGIKLSKEVHARPSRVLTKSNGLEGGRQVPATPASQKGARPLKQPPSTSRVLQTAPKDRVVGGKTTGTSIDASNRAKLDLKSGGGASTSSSSEDSENESEDGSGTDSEEEVEDGSMEDSKEKSKGRSTEDSEEESEDESTENSEDKSGDVDMDSRPTGTSGISEGEKPQASLGPTSRSEHPPSVANGLSVPVAASQTHTVQGKGPSLKQDGEKINGLLDQSLTSPSITLGSSDSSSEDESEETSSSEGEESASSDDESHDDSSSSSSDEERSSSEEEGGEEEEASTSGSEEAEEGLLHSEHRKYTNNDTYSSLALDFQQPGVLTKLTRLIASQSSQVPATAGTQEQEEAAGQSGAGNGTGGQVLRNAGIGEERGGDEEEEDAWGDEDVETEREEGGKKTTQKMPTKGGTGTSTLKSLNKQQSIAQLRHELLDYVNKPRVAENKKPLGRLLYDRIMKPVWWPANLEWSTKGIETARKGDMQVVLALIRENS